MTVLYKRTIPPIEMHCFLNSVLYFGEYYKFYLCHSSPPPPPPISFCLSAPASLYPPPPPPPPLSLRLSLCLSLSLPPYTLHSLSPFLSSMEEQFGYGDADAAKSHPTRCSSLRKGGYVLLKGHPCRLVEKCTAAPGKHGPAKVY